MKKNLIFPFIIALSVIAVVALFVILIKINSPKTNDNLIFFYSPTCPHCQKVEEFFTANKITDLIDFSQVDITESSSTSALFAEKVSACGIDKKNVGVPILWNNGKCLNGDVDIIQFFKEKTGL